MKKTLLIIAGIVVVVLIYGFTTFNNLTTANVAVDGQWAQVETQYQRRFDLIPNLVAAVQGIFEQEKTVFTALADARARYSGAQTIDQKAQAATQVESALSRLLVVVENYPQLKSSESIQNLMAELAGTENRVAFERKKFNESVQSYDLLIQRFPSSIIASITGFKTRAYFQAVEGSEVAPTVKF